jgi:hypothetical protein
LVLTAVAALSFKISSKIETQNSVLFSLSPFHTSL